jgi:dipeptidyl aminopeptidase/acylaminoacyl peptidase
MRTDGSDIEQLTAHENPAFGGSYSPDGKYIAYGSNEEGDLRNSDIYVVTPDGESVERVVQLSVGSKENFSEWHPDSSSFAFSTDIDGLSRPGIYNIETHEITLMGDQAYNEIPTKFSKDGKKLYCLVNNDASIYPSAYDIQTGERRVFDFPRGIAAGGEITEDGKLVMTLNTSNKPSELILFDPETEEIETLMKTDLTGIDDSLFVSSDYIRYPSTHNAEIPAIVFKPRDFDPAKRYPAIIVAHGGPTGQYFNTFTAMAQYYTDNGYVVMYPNVRGSTGYGAEFRDACLKDWGGKDLDDWAAGRQYLIDKYSVDPDRIAITGGSYGGYATLISVGRKPSLWKLGAAVVPISHLQTLYEDDMPHFKYYLRQQMGDPVKDKELWEERSPINYADQVTAKMLLLHGENDPRCPVAESRNYIEALKKSGKVEGEDFEYVEIKGQGHGMFTDRTARIRDAKIVSEYIMKHL